MGIKKTTDYAVPKGVWTKITTDEKAISLNVKDGWFDTTVSDTDPAGTNENTPINATHTKGSNKIIFGIPSGSSVYAWGIEDSVVFVDPSEA